MTEKLRNYRIIYFFEVKMANANGNPTSGEPRILPDGRICVSYACQKNKMRQAMLRQGLDILHIDEEDGRTIIDKLQPFRLEGKQYNTSDILKKYWDIRLFGATDLNANIRLTVKGAVTVSNAVSLDRVELVPMLVNRSYKFDQSESGEEINKGFANGLPVVEYALMSTYVGINYYTAKQNGVTDEDIQNLHKAIKLMFLDDASVSRPVGSINMRKIITISWTGRAEDGPSDATIQDIISNGITRCSHRISSYSDYAFDLTELEKDTRLANCAVAIWDA